MVNRSAAVENAMLPLSTVSSWVIYAVIMAITILMLQQGLKRTEV